MLQLFSLLPCTRVPQSRATPTSGLLLSTVEARAPRVLTAPMQLGGEPQTQSPGLAGAMGAAAQKEPTGGACPDGANTRRVGAVSGA